MSSVEPYDHADQQNSSQKRAGELVITCCYRAEILQGAEEALNEVALAVEGEIGVARLLSIGFRRDHRRDVACLEVLEEGIAIVTLVGDQGVGLDLIEQRFGLRDVGGLPRRQREREGVTERIDDSVDLGGQSAA